MPKQIFHSIIVGVVVLNLAPSTHAFQNRGGGTGGNQGGFGFTGSPGYGFTGPRGSGFTETLGPTSATDASRRFRRTPSSPGRPGTEQSLGEMFVNLRRAQNANRNRSALGWINPYMASHRAWF